jgi:hypothetical protein
MGRGVRAVAAGAVGVFLAGLMGTTAVAVAPQADPAPAPEPAAASADPKPGGVRPALQGPGAAPNHDLDRIMQPPAFAVTATQHTPGRAGGVGVVDARVARAQAPGVAVRSMKVRLFGPSGTRIARVQGLAGARRTGSWSCALSAVRLPASGKAKAVTVPGAVCSLSGGLASGELPPELRAWVSIPSPAMLVRKVPIRAQVSWVEDKVAANLTGASGTDRVVGVRTKSLVGVARLAVDPALRVKFEVGQKHEVTYVAGGSTAEHTGRLSATIINAGNRHVSARWEQLPGGPRVRFVQPVSVHDAADGLGQEYLIPDDLPDGTKLGFRVSATSLGQTTTAVTTVTVRRHRTGRFDPRTELLHGLAKARPVGPKRGHPVVSTPARILLNGGGAREVKTGAPVRLSVVGAGAVQRVDWSVVAGGDPRVVPADAHGAAVTFRAPNAATKLVVRAVIVTKDGRRVSRSRTVLVAAPPAPARRAAATAVAPDPCRLRPGQVVTLGDGSRLTLSGRFAVPRGCRPGSFVAFSDASVTYGAGHWVQVSGQFRPAGIVVSRARLSLPGGFARYLPASVAGTGSVALPAGTALVARPARGGWGAWTGAFPLPWAKVLPTPAGWVKSRATYTLGVTPGGPAKAMISQFAAHGATGGSQDIDVSWGDRGQAVVDMTAANLAVLPGVKGSDHESSGHAQFVLSTARSQDSGAATRSAVTAQDAGAAPVTMPFPCPTTTTAQGCQVMTNVWLVNPVLTITPGSTTMGLTSQVNIGAGTNTYSMNGVGAYTGQNNWTMNVVGTNPWQIGATGVSVTNLTGTVAATPTATGGLGQVAVDVTGADVTGVNVPSMTVSNITATATNSCTANQTCDTSQVNMGIVVNGSVVINGQTDTVKVTAPVDMTTMTVGTWNASGTFAAPMFTGITIGPAQLQVTAATLTLTNAGATATCAPTGAPAPAPAPTTGVNLVLGVHATVTLGGADPFTGQPGFAGWPVHTWDPNMAGIDGTINPDGYCLWKAFGDGEVQGLDTREVIAGYSSYPGGATLSFPTSPQPVCPTPTPTPAPTGCPASPATPNPSASPSASPSPSGSAPFTMNLPAGGTFQFQGTLTVPDDIGTELVGINGVTMNWEGHTDATTTAVDVTAAFAPASPKLMSGHVDANGNATSSALTFNSLSLTGSLSATTFMASLNLSVNGDLVMAQQGSACPLDATTVQTGCSYTPLSGGITLATASVDYGQVAHGWEHSQKTFAVSLYVNDDPTTAVGATANLGVCPGTVNVTNPDGEFVPANPQPKCVLDAFGQQGLSIATLGFSLGYVWNGPWELSKLAINPGPPPADLENKSGPAVSMAATVFLPDRWTTDISLRNSPQVTLNAAIGPLDTCVQFSIGSQDPNAQEAFDVANAGVVTGSYLYVLYAPQGCKITVGAVPMQIEPGYGVAFDGQLFGDQVTAQMNVSFGFGNENLTAANDTHVWGALNIGAFSLNGVSVQNTLVNFDLWAGPYLGVTSTVAFSGGLQVGDPTIVGGSAQINGYAAITPAQVNLVGANNVAVPSGASLTLVLGGSGTISVGDGLISASLSGGDCPTGQIPGEVGQSWPTEVTAPGPGGTTTSAPITNCIVSLAMQDGQFDYLGVNANISLSILGTSLDAQLALIYSNDQLLQLHIGLGATLNFWVGSVGGAVYVDYCNGTLTPNGDGSTDAASCATSPTAADSVMRVEFADGTFKLGWCPFCYQTTFGPYNIYNHETANPAPPPQPVLNSDLSLKVPAGYTSLPASAYSLEMLLDNPDSVIAGIWQGNPDDDISAQFAVKAIAPGGGPDAPCPQPTTGVAWQPTADNPNPVANNIPTIPVGTTCDIQVVFSQLDPFGFPTIPSEQDMTNALNTPSMWGAPQVGYISCTNDGWATVWDDGVNCVFPWSDATLAPSVNPPGSTYAEVAPKILAQLSYGMTTPFGVLPAGMQLATGSTLWSPDGTTALSFSAPTDPNNGPSASQLMLSVGGTYPDKGLSGGQNVPAWTAPGGGSVTYPPQPPAVVSNGSLTMGTNGVATVNDGNGNPVWNSPQPTSPLLGKPYLEVAGGGMWVQDAGNPGFPVWGTTPPQGTFELHQTYNRGVVQIPSGPNGEQQDAGIGLEDRGCLVESNGQLQMGRTQPGTCAQFSYVTNLNGQTSVQGTGWLQLADGNCVTPPTQDQWTSGGADLNVGPCAAGNSNYWSFPGDGTIRAFEVWPVGGTGGPTWQCLSGQQMQQCPSAPNSAQGTPAFFTMMTPGAPPPPPPPPPAPDPDDEDEECLEMGDCF